MDKKDTIKVTRSKKRLIQDNYYYKNVFKKTERIVGVVFYIAHNANEKDKCQPVRVNLTDQAQQVHQAVLASLNTPAHQAEESSCHLIHTLVALESTLAVAHIVGFVPSEIMTLLKTETHTVCQALTRYHITETGLQIEPFNHSESTPSALNSPALTATAVNNAPAELAYDTHSRQARLRAVIAAKKEASIKDITDIITDVGGKTIQRELNAMIADNQIKRVGRRRWSRYVLV